MDDHSANRPNHETPQDEPPVEGDADVASIVVTSGSTSADPTKRLRLSKVYAATGKWPVTPGVKRQAFLFESAHCADLETLAVDLRARMKDGGSALVAGRLKLLPRLIDRRKAHRRTAENFADFPCWVLFLDFDGLTATKAGMRIDRPEDFGEAALEEALKLLPAAFDADHIVYATSSSGLPRNAKGEPANGRAWFRLAFWLKRPLTFAEQKQIVLALQQLPGLQCLDVAIYAIPQFNFITRPEFPAGMADPIEKPVLLCKGALRQVDVDALLTEIGVTLTSRQRPGPRPPAGGEERRLNVAPELRVPLTRQAVAAIVNDLDRIDWVHFAHAIDGSLDGDPAGRDIFLKFSARWMEETDPEEEDDFEWVEGETDPEEGTDPEEEAERVWDTRGEGRAGFGYLMRLLEKQGTPEAEAAIFAIRQAQAAARQAQAAAAFPDPPPDHDDDDDENDDDDDDDDVLLARRAPTIDPRAFYGPLDRIVTETTKDSEATKVGVAAQIIAHVSLTLRPFYNPLGNGKISFNVYLVQLGPADSDGSRHL